MHEIEDLDGTTLARGVAGPGGVSLTLVAASGFSDNGYYPAESITLTSPEGLKLLHALLGKMLEAHTLPPNVPLPIGAFKQQGGIKL